MKKIIYLSIKLLFVIFSFVSCSNDFLKVEQKVETQLTDTIFMSDFDHQLPVNFNLERAGNAHWRILQFPSWLKISPMEGNFTNGKSSFQLEVSTENSISQWGWLSLPLVIDVDGIGLVQYPFAFYHFGNPRVGLSNYDLSLGYQSLGTFTIHNYEGGILIWNISNKPDWLTISTQSGMLNPGEDEKITVVISRDKLGKGEYIGDINLAVNSIEKTLTVKVTIKVTDPSMSGNLYKIEGEVVDADYCKATGLMAVAGKNPNRLYFFKPDQAVKTLDLNKIPINIAVSETGDQIAATFTNTDLSLINPESLTITKSIQTGIISSDLALGGNGWAYVSPKIYSTNYLLSVNLISGEIVQQTSDMNGLSLLKKVPGKNLLYGTKTGWSPDFLIVFDISNGAANNSADMWWTTLYKFWLSEDGNQVFSGMRKIYKSPAFTGTGNIMENPRLAGELEEISGTITAMDHCSAIKELFVVYKSYNYEVGTRVLRIDDSGYYTKGAFLVNNLMIEDNGNYLSINPDVPYLFVDKPGKAISLIKSGMSNSGKTYWYYEKIDLK